MIIWEALHSKQTTYTNFTKRIIKKKKRKIDIKLSTNKKKKLDVFKDGYKIASIGAAGMNDYPTYIRTKGMK